MTSQVTAIELDTMTFPLFGARLIEASAGTGKTFTIAGLYLRLLLGHGSDTCKHQRPLTVDQILVVTFTEAATAELRDRIRTRIHQARMAFSRGCSDDPVIQPLLNDIQDHKHAAALLLNAERQMDEAAVYTIHGFCQRMLTQNAFESGSRFNNEFVTDESQLRNQVVADYWRKNFYGLPLQLAAEIRQIWSSPADLASQIGKYLTGAPLKISTQAMTGSLVALHEQNLEKIAAFKAQWLEAESEVIAAINDSDVSKRSYTKKSLPQWHQVVTLWAQSPTHDYRIPDQLSKFAQNVLEDKTPKGQPPVLTIFGETQAFLEQPPTLKAPLLAHGIQECRVMLAKAKAQKQWLSFDDLLSQLSAALDSDDQQVLSERIRSLYPVAMIDEFQDTDPLQYSIFSRIYLPYPQCGLFMIGDPKQAIYGFRGADIFTYIKARNQVSAHYTLGTNWRSSAAMVASVNQVFQLADSAFVYDDDIPFLPVSSSPVASQKQWQLNQETQAALTYWCPETPDKPISKSEYQEVMCNATVSQIQTILTAAKSGDACLLNGEKQRVVDASDIAVLVRTGTEGQMIKQALAEKGIASVYLSNRDSVFTSKVAQDVQRLLQAVLYFEDERILRASLAGELFALNAFELDQLNNAEEIWENVVMEFSEYRKLWVQRGVLPMLRAVISRRHIAERLLASDNGERILTDLMHLSELLQQASMELESDHGLVRWLAQSISDAAKGIGGSDEQIQRLESDRNLVQIVTIHKSKGLEYNLVFLPFVMSHRDASEAKYYDAEQDATLLDITASDGALKLADKERLAEDLRLLYVALTRAVYACFIGTAPLRAGRSTKEPTGVDKSAMGYLLQNGQAGGIADLELSIQRQIESLDCMRSTLAPELCDKMYLPPQEEHVSLNAKEVTRAVDSQWRIGSYSGLVKQGSHHQDASFEIAGFDFDSSQEEEEVGPSEPAFTIFTFPKGAKAGTFLHTLFEEVDFTRSAYEPHNTEIIEELMVADQVEDHWLPILQSLVDTVLGAPLDGESLRLKDKSESQRLTEMEFLLPVALLSAPELNRLVHRYDPLSAKAGELGFHTMKGMIKGFIDLVFEHKGKYYVLDWKSNYLGDDVSFYHGEALNNAMAEHRYDLQYQIYSLALHRFLRSRIPDYDYEHHFGGVYYLFLRGIDGQSENGIFKARPDLALITKLDAMIEGKSEERETNTGQMELDL